MDTDPDYFARYLGELLDDEVIEGPAAGITRQVQDQGLDSLSAKQKYVFSRDVEPLFPGPCKRCRGEVPWEEACEYRHNGGFCGWCANVIDKAKRDV